MASGMSFGAQLIHMPPFDPAHFRGDVKRAAPIPSAKCTSSKKSNLGEPEVVPEHMLPESKPLSLPTSLTGLIHRKTCRRVLVRESSTCNEYSECYRETLKGASLL